MSAIDPKPNNLLVSNPKPANSGVINTQPKNTAFGGQNFTFIENRTIKVGQPIPWGLNWLITYPITMVFQGKRI